MRLLVLGGKGMAGHMMFSYLNTVKDFKMAYTSRNQNDKKGIYLDVRNEHNVKKLLEKYKPDVVINCTGLLNENAKNHLLDAIQVNSLLPHQIAEWIGPYGGKLIHISTDCVFSGEKGSYQETDKQDGNSVYAKTKALGEVTHSPHLTIRTSIIGPELKDGIGLYRWFMNQSGKIKGFTEVYWNGVTTLELAKGIRAMIEQSISGLYHFTAPRKISKYELLNFIQQTFQKMDVEILPDSAKVLDRTLKNSRTDFSYVVPDYREMLTELKEWADHHD